MNHLLKAPFCVHPKTGPFRLILEYIMLITPIDTQSHVTYTLKKKCLVNFQVVYVFLSTQITATSLIHWQFQHFHRY